MRLSLRRLDTTEELNRFLRNTGLLILCSYVVLVPLSYGIAAVSPYGFRQPQEAIAFRSLVDAGWIPWAFVVAFLDRYVSGDSILAIKWVRVVAYCVPMSIATVGAILATVRLSLDRHLISDSTVTVIVRMSVAFALVNVVMYPMFTEDMWLSVVWGRMLTEGHNPYYEYFTTEALSGTPLRSFPIRMTYGPLWAWISAIVARASEASPVAMFLTAKLALFAFWTFSVLIIRAILDDKPLLHRAAAVCFFGWWPVSVRMAVGGGHNDIAMVCPMLLWLYYAERDSRWLAIEFLTASVLIKYVTAPLMIVELWRGLKLPLRPRWPFVAAVGCAALAALLVTAPLWRDWRFLDPVLRMEGWRFLTPAQAASSMLGRLGIPLGIGMATTLVRIAFGAVVFSFALEYARRPSRDSLVQLVLAIMMAVLLAGVGHMWPWFVIWIIGPAALAGRGHLWRLSLALALVAPFLNLFWIATSGWAALPLTGVLFFSAVGVIAVSPLGWNRIAWGASTPHAPAAWGPRPRSSSRIPYTAEEVRVP